MKSRKSRYILGIIALAISLLGLILRFEGGAFADPNDDHSKKKGDSQGLRYEHLGF